MRRFLKNTSIAILLAACAAAQQDRAVITGTVTDPAKAAVNGASIEVTNKSTGFHREVKTNDAGFYVVPGLLIGVYDVNIKMDGFRPAQFDAVELVVGQIRTIDSRLQIASSTQEVQVQAEVTALAQSNSTVGGVIGGTQVANLPMNGRAWTSLMALVPGAIDSGGGTQKSIRFAGRGADDNNFRFDGVDATNINSQAPGTGYRLQISTEAIAEFKVDTALYGAESGGSSGGQVEVISKTGTNAFHGSVFEFIRNDKISTRGPFDPSAILPLRLNQYGSSFGGPIVKNRTFFFLAYEGLRQRVSNTLIGNVPSDSFRAAVLAQSPALAPIIKAFPIGNRALSSTTSQYVSPGSLQTDEDSGMFRIDHRIADSTNLFVRYNLDKVTSTAPSGALLDKTVTSSTPMNGTVNLAHVFAPTMFNVVQLGFNRIHSERATDSHFFDVTGIFSSVSVPGFTKLSQAANSIGSPTSYTLKDDFTWTRGTHAIKAGVEIKRVMYNYSQAPENALVYASFAGFQANQLDQVNLIGGVPMHGLDKTLDFGYIQDAWKVRPNLTVNLGVRYEFFDVFHEIYGRSLAFDIKTCGGFCPQGSEFTIPNTKNIEPRVSFAWTPEALHGKAVVRSGFGIYKGEGQLGDLNAPSDNFTQRSSLSSASFTNLKFPADSFYALAGNVAVTPRGLDRSRKDPTIDQWGMQLQFALPASFVLDTGYLGYHAYHQFARTYVNLIDPRTGLRPLAAFGPIDVKSADDNSHFHAWQTSLNRRFQSGVSFSAHYMWSHGINDGSTGGGEADYAQNTACRTCEVASADFDVRHTFTANTVLELPFGKGRHFLNSNGPANAVLGGWQMSGLGTFRSGNPVNVTMSRPASALLDGLSLQNNSSYQRPNYMSGVSVVPANQTISNWINAAAFSTPANGTWGNAGRNLIRGPQFWQADISLTKHMRISEKLGLTFRADAFNVFNRAQFGDPSGNLSSSSFGTITSTVNNGTVTGSGTPRQFQFSLRLVY